MQKCEIPALLVFAGVIRRGLLLRERRHLSSFEITTKLHLRHWDVPEKVPDHPGLRRRVVGSRWKQCGWLREAPGRSCKDQIRAQRAASERWMRLSPSRSRCRACRLGTVRLTAPRMRTLEDEAHRCRLWILALDRGTCPRTLRLALHGSSEYSRPACGGIRYPSCSPCRMPKLRRQALHVQPTVFEPEFAAASQHSHDTRSMTVAIWVTGTTHGRSFTTSTTTTTTITTPFPTFEVEPKLLMDTLSVALGFANPTAPYRNRI